MNFSFEKPNHGGIEELPRFKLTGKLYPFAKILDSLDLGKRIDYNSLIDRDDLIMEITDEGMVAIWLPTARGVYRDYIVYDPFDHNLMTSDGERILGNEERSSQLFDRTKLTNQDIITAYERIKGRG